MPHVGTKAPPFGLNSVTVGKFHKIDGIVNKPAKAVNRGMCIRTILTLAHHPYVKDRNWLGSDLFCKKEIFIKSKSV